jgi:hypothetical protein
MSSSLRDTVPPMNSSRRSSGHEIGNQVPRYAPEQFAAAPSLLERFAHVGASGFCHGGRSSRLLQSTRKV